MSFFTSSATGKGYSKLPNVMMLQWGNINVATASADVSIDQCQISFPN